MWERDLKQFADEYNFVSLIFDNEAVESAVADDVTTAKVYHTDTHVHTYMYIHTCTYTHTRIHKCIFLLFFSDLFLTLLVSFLFKSSHVTQTSIPHLIINTLHYYFSIINDYSSIILLINDQSLH